MIAYFLTICECQQSMKNTHKHSWFENYLGKIIRKFTKPWPGPSEPDASEYLRANGFCDFRTHEWFVDWCTLCTREKQTSQNGPTKSNGRKIVSRTRPNSYRRSYSKFSQSSWAIRFCYCTSIKFRIVVAIVRNLGGRRLTTILRSISQAALKYSEINDKWIFNPILFLKTFQILFDLQKFRVQEGSEMEWVMIP